MEDDNLIGHTHQELQVLACFIKKGLPLDYNTNKIPEFIGKNIYYRPDFVIRTNPIIIVEVDEDAHRAYDIHKEVKRLEVIWDAFFGNVLFIRVNVDRKYQLDKDKLIAIYDKVTSYSNYTLPSDRIIVDHMFYEDNDIDRYIKFPKVKLLQRDQDQEMSVMSITDISCGSDTTTEDSSDDIDEKPSIVQSDDSILCERCGFKFQYRSLLKKHLKLKISCSPIHSNIDRSLLLKKIEDYKSSVKIHVCVCGYGYKYITGLYQHRRSCSQYQNKQKSLVTDELRRELNELKKKVDKMEKYRTSIQG